MKKKIIFAVVFLIIGASIGYAAEMILASSVYYDNTSSNLGATNVQDAIDELYEASKSSWKFDFDYSGSIQAITIPLTGTYQLETWGASGGSVNKTYHGGYGGYSRGIIELSRGDTIYIVIGGAGSFTSGTTKGGYNGGGNSTPDTTYYTASGGGATHIATSSGLLSTLSSNKSSVLIVSGGGGGTAQDQDGKYFGIGGSGGGYIGSSGTSEYNSSFIGGGGTQTAGGASSITKGSFGKGGNASASSSSRGGGGGAGWYGGGSGKSFGAAGGGGSGYIGNDSLTDKIMYCYNCEESEEEFTKTVSTTCVSETPTSNCSKIGNGYARITLIT